jgi:hypothetical protein
VPFVKYNQNSQVKEDEMCGACSTHEREEECVQGFGGKARRKNHQEDMDAGRVDNIKMILEK